MFRLTVRSDFAASHHLRDYAGKCKRLHGHTWKVEVAVKGETLNRAGMLTDFKVIKSRLKTVLSKFDHAHLNDLPVFKRVNPTSENIAKHLFTQLSRSAGSGKTSAVNVESVTVWESETSSVTYSHE